MRKELKEFVEDADFIEKMNKAFADLRADYELDLDESKEKINELKAVHVDNKNHLSNLISYSTKSSGIVSGLRGTGKTHLFLLSRESINENINKNKAIVIYLNVKRLHLPEKFSQEEFNRILSMFLYNELIKQLNIIIYQLQEETYLKRFLALFKNNNKEFIINLEKAIIKIGMFKEIIKLGSQTYVNLELGNIKDESFNKELLDIKNKIASKLKVNSAEISAETAMTLVNEIGKNMATNNTYLTYLNIQDVRTQLVDILKLLKLDAITFYIDEWEKLYYNRQAQEYLAFYIDRMIDTPIYFWLGLVPYRGKLYSLDNGADLQHFINLDDSLVYENSKTDKEICVNYFKKFINNRLNQYLGDLSLDYSTLFNSDKKLEMLVLASMGNSRDFGTMLLFSWSEFQNYRINGIYSGRPFKYISEDMIINAIKNDGDKKISNIRDDNNLMRIWKDLEEYCTLKKCSHFAIEETKNNMETISNEFFSELIYHRLLHFRKGHVPPKEAKIKNKLSIYALNYACTYDSHAKDKKFEFVTKYDIIHDRVRRYIYEPDKIIQNVRVKNGEIFPCKSCSESININKMKHAWEKNSCPFCGGTIYNKQE